MLCLWEATDIISNIYSYGMLIGVARLCDWRRVPVARLRGPEDGSSGGRLLLIKITHG